MEKYKVVNGTSYHIETSDKLINVLERVRQNKTRIKVTFGETETGTPWNEEHDIYGYIGRSTGNKIPLLVYNSRSYGGSSLSTNRILKVCESKGGKVLYIVDNYKEPVITIVHNKMGMIPYSVIVNDIVWAYLKTSKQAERLKYILL